MGTVSYDDCDCVPGHYCDCQEYRQPLDAERARTVVLTEKVRGLPGLSIGEGTYPEYVSRASVLELLAVLPVDRVGVEPLGRDR